MSREIKPEDRGRFTNQEAMNFREGLCCWCVEYGTGRGVVLCDQPAVMPETPVLSTASLYCAEHQRPS